MARRNEENAERPTPNIKCRSSDRWYPKLTVVAAAVREIERFVLIGVHVKREITPLIMSAVLDLLMAFIAYGRLVLKPIF